MATNEWKMIFTSFVLGEGIAARKERRAREKVLIREGVRGWGELGEYRWVRRGWLPLQSAPYNIFKLIWDEQGGKVLAMGRTWIIPLFCVPEFEGGWIQILRISKIFKGVRLFRTPSWIEGSSSGQEPPPEADAQAWLRQGLFTILSVLEPTEHTSLPTPLYHPQNTHRHHPPPSATAPRSNLPPAGFHPTPTPR